MAQRQTEVGEPEDAAEHEADAVADAVLEDNPENGPPEIAEHPTGAAQARRRPRRPGRRRRIIAAQFP